MDDKTRETLVIYSAYGYLGCICAMMVVAMIFGKPYGRAVVTDGNVASERVLRKCGFALQHIAANTHCIGGKYFADHVYQLHLSANHL